jgi:5'-phosphate synthase pdxT subunit
VLASQGDFEAHARVLRSLGADPVEVRRPGQLDELDGLVIPGGESTTISKAIERDGLIEPIRAHVERGAPLLGTCAGMIVCDREHLGLMDVVARRNAFGRQRHSFECDLEIEGLGPDPLRAVFIRAPWIEEHGPEVEVLASYEGHPVVVRQGRIIACAFHPELTDDSRLHALLMAHATAAREAAGDRA